MKTLIAVANRVENAARWAMQEAFPGYPVFVGPLVSADIMMAGFAAAESRYVHQVGRIMQNSQESKDTTALGVGPVIERLDKWAKTVQEFKRVSPTKRKHVAKRDTAAPATPLWNAASAAPEGVAKNLNADFSTPAGRESSKAPRDSGTSVDFEAPAVAIPGKKVFYGVGRGIKPGVYASWEEAQAQVLHFSGSRVKRFKSVVSAERYVAQVQAEKRAVWYVLKNSGRDGAYESRETAEAYRCAGSSIVEKNSLTAVKRYLGKNRVRVFREEPEEKQSSAASDSSSAPAAAAAAMEVKDVKKSANSQNSTAAAPSSQESSASAGSGVADQFFAIKGGSEDGVYASLKEVLAALAKGGGEFEVFDSETDAANYCRPPDASALAVEDTFVVWSGKSTGVMNAMKCVKATAGVKGARAEGPMTKEKATSLWKAKQKKTKKQSASAEQDKKDESQSSSSNSLKHVEYPSDADWAKVAAGKQKRVFACWTSKGKGRIAFSWDEATHGIKDNVSVEVFNAESTLFLNFARAEEYLANASDESSISDRIAAARKAVAAKRDPKKTPSARDASATADTAGKSAGVRVGMTGVVLTREITQIRRCFIDAAKAVVIRGSPHEPEEDELERDMPAPGSATYLSDDVESHEGSDKGELTLLEFFSYKKNKTKAWPLKSFGEFLSFCRQGQRLCSSSSKEVGVANAAFFMELLDMAVKVHQQMVRRGTLGPEEIRFEVRMYLHLQYACNYGVMFTGASACRAFEMAVDSFGTAKVPRFRKLMKRSSDGRSGARGAGRGGGYKTPVTAKPASGCYLCPASDHYANDPKFHPLPADGKRAPISPDKKKAILARIDNSSLSVEEKTAEKAQVRKYWSQHSL